MRLVSVVLVVVVSVWGGRPLSAAMLDRTTASAGHARPVVNQGEDPADGERLFASAFVYQPAPTPPLWTDPRFYREGFIAAPVPVAAGLLVATGVISPSLPAPPVPATPGAEATVSAAQPLSVPSTPSPTPVILPASMKPLFHEPRYDFRAAVPLAVTPTALLPVGEVAATAATPAPTPVAQPTPAAVRIADADLDIEDPRFYRGSFSLAPPSAASAVPDATGQINQLPAPGYGGYSVDTLNPAYGERTPLPVGGKAMYYNPGIMQEVYTYRIQLGQIQPCAECVGYVALLRRGDLNRRVWLQWNNGAIEGPFLVIDVAAHHHVTQLLSRGWVVDVDYLTALRRGMAGPVPVTILDAPAPAK